MKNLFKPEDFKLDGIFEADQIMIAWKANKILADYLEKNGEKVWGSPKKNLSSYEYDLWKTYNEPHSTHTALLINREPIVKEKCEHHDAIKYRDYNSDPEVDYWRCRKCGVKLKQVFEEAE